MAPHSSTLAWKLPWTEDPGAIPHSHPTDTLAMCSFSCLFRIFQAQNLKPFLRPQKSLQGKFWEHRSDKSC